MRPVALDTNTYAGFKRGDDIRSTLQADRRPAGAQQLACDLP
jgi:hypothetical protein